MTWKVPLSLIASSIPAMLPAGELPSWLKEGAFFGLAIWLLLWLREIFSSVVDRIDTNSLLLVKTQEAMLGAVKDASGIDLDDTSDDRIRALSGHYTEAIKRLDETHKLIKERMGKDKR